MKKIYEFDELLPEAQEHARKAHCTSLAPFYRELLDALFRHELTQEGYPEVTIVFDPAPDSLIITDIVAEGAILEPTLIEKLYQEGVMEMEHQYNAPVIEEGILAEGLLFFKNGAPARCPCEPDEYRYYDKMFFVGGKPYLSLDEHVKKHCTANGLSRRIRPRISAELEKVFLHAPRRKLEELEIITSLISLSLRKNPKNDKSLEWLSPNTWQNCSLATALIHE